MLKSDFQDHVSVDKTNYMVICKISRQVFQIHLWTIEKKEFSLLFGKSLLMKFGMSVN